MSWREQDGSLELDPPLELIEPTDVTLDKLTNGCYLLGVDPDDVLAGKPVELPEHPPLATADQFLRLTVKNYDQYDFWEMQYGRARAILGVAADHFIKAPAKK